MKSSPTAAKSLQKTLGLAELFGATVVDPDELKLALARAFDRAWRATIGRGE
jgi:hypothetical protein